MVLSSPEQIAASQSAGLDAFFGLTGKVFECVGKLAALNMQVARSTMTESLGAMVTLLPDRGPTT